MLEAGNGTGNGRGNLRRTNVRPAAALDRHLLTTSAMTRVVSVLAVAGAIALPSGPALAQCVPLSANAESVVCAGNLDGTLSDALGGNDTITFTTDVGVNDAATVSGGSGNDSIAMGDGRDVGVNAAGAGQVLGDEGNDTITLRGNTVGASGAGTVSGGDGADSVFGSGFSAVIPNAADDMIFGGLAGGTGQLLGEDGEDTITLERVFVGNGGGGTVSGGDADDSITLTDGSALGRGGGSLAGAGQVLGDAGEDTITLRSSAVGYGGLTSGTVSGGTGDDVIGVFDNSAVGFGGTGQVLGAAGDDTITVGGSTIGRSGSGAGTVSGGGDDDVINVGSSTLGRFAGSTGQALGDEGADTITISNSTVALAGGATVSGGADDDSIAVTGARMGYSGTGSGQVLGDEGADTISLNATRVGESGGGTVSGGEGADSILLSNNSNVGLNLGSTGQVLGDEGADTIALANTGVGYRGDGTVSGGADADSIALSNGTRVGSGGGSGQVLGEAGADTITLDASVVGNGPAGTVSGGADADSIAVRNGSVLGGTSIGAGRVLGDDGADTITVGESTVGYFGGGTVSGGADNDSITVIDSHLGVRQGSSGVVLGDAGNDTIFVDPSYVGYAGDGTVSGGAGADSITFEDSFIGFTETGQGQVLGEAGADTITLDNTSVGEAGAGTVSGGADADSIALSNFSNIGNESTGTGQVLGEDGNDTITLADSDVGRAGDGTVSGGSDNDSIALSTGSNIGFFAGSTGQVLGDAGNDTITIASSDVGDEGDGTVSGGEGNDSIALSSLGTIGDADGSSGQVLGATGNDTITLNRTTVGNLGDGTVSGGAAADSIALRNRTYVGDLIGGTGQVLGDDGADTITLDNADVGVSGAGTVSGGGDADSIALTNVSEIGSNTAGTGQVLGDAGADTITLDDSIVGRNGNGTVSGGMDNDSIALSNGSAIGRNPSGSGQVLGGDGADTVTLDNTDVGRGGAGTVSGGMGADSIALSNFSVLGDFTNSTGQVLGDAGADTITLSRSKVGEDGAGTVSGGADADSIALSTSYIGDQTDGTGQVLGDGGADTITLNQSLVGRDGDGTVSGGGENDSIVLSNRSILGYSGGSTGQVLGDAGNDTIRLIGSDVGYQGDGTVSGGMGADSIALGALAVSTGFLGDQAGSTGQVLGDEGADTITLVDIHVGEDGAGTVSGGADADSIALSFGSVLGRRGGGTGQVLGDDGADTITLSQSIVGQDGDGTVSGGMGADSIALNNLTILGDTNGSTGQVLGDTGADTITLDNADVGLDGAGTVSGGADADSIALSNGSLIGALAFGTGQVLGDAGADTITLDQSTVGDRGDGTVSGGTENDSITVIDSSIGRYAGSTGVVLGDAGNDTIFVDPSYVGYSGDGTVSGGTGNDSIAFVYSFIGFNPGSTGQVLGDEGADTIALDNSIVGFLGDGTVSGGADNDSIALTNGGAIGQFPGTTGQVLGDAGNDTIAFDNSAVGVSGGGTVDGGANNDSIVLSNGAFVGAQGQVLGGAGDDTVGIDDSVTRTAGSLIDGGTETDLLAFTANNDTTLPPDQVLNFEQFEKRGAATLTLTGDQTWVDSTEIVDGTLIVGGQLTSATTTVNPGTRLETLGGSFVGSLVNRGTFSPGGDATIETTSVSGDFVHDADGVFVVNITPSSADRVNVGGTATIEGGEVQVIAEDTQYEPGTRYTIISADGGREGEFDEVSDNLVFLDPFLEYDANNVFLVLDRNGTPLPFGLQCTTDNRLCDALLNLSPQGARTATKALSGEVHGTLGAVLIDQSRYVREAILGRLAQATYDGDQIAPVAGPVSLDTEALKLGPADAPYVNGNSGVTFWTEGFGAWGDFDGGAASSADTEIAGFISGLDARVSETWRVGLATGYTWSDIDVDALFSSAEVESYYLAAYAGGMAGPFALRTGGAYAWQDIDTARAVVFPGFFERETASYDADTGQIFGELAYPMSWGNAAVEPFAGLAYVHFDADAFRERGGLAALRGASTSTDTGYTTLGVRIAQTMQWGNAIVTPRISAAWQHAFDDLTVPAALAFQTGAIGGFTVTGVPIAEDSFLLDTGLDVKAGENTTLGVSYSGQFASGVTDNAVKGRFRWRF